MPSVNIRDPFTEAALRETRPVSARAGRWGLPPAGRWGLHPALVRRWVLCRASGFVLLGGVLALAAMLRG